MIACGRVAGWVLLALGLVAVAARLAAAPAPKPRPDELAIDLSAVHALIAKVQPGVDLPEGDLTRVKESLSRLLTRLDALEGLPAGYPKGRKLPVVFDRFRTAEVVEKVNLIQQKNALVAGGDGRMTQSAFSVMLVSGDAEVVQSHDCVVVAGGKAKLIQSYNCVVVAGRSVELSQCVPRKKGDNQAPAAGAAPEPAVTVAVAGERLKGSQSRVGIGAVLRPGKDGPAIQSSQCRDFLFLNAPGDWKSLHDEGCRADPPKAPIAR
jgi:hypothetical protein